MNNLASHKLSVGVVRKTLAAWGVLDVRVNQAEGGDDTMTIVEATADFNESAFTGGQRIELWDSGGIRRFSGDLVRPAEEYNGGRLRATWNACGPLWRMTKLPFKLPRTFMVNPTIEGSDTFANDTVNVVLNRVPALGSRASLRAEIVKVFDQAAALGAYVTTSTLEVPDREIAEQQVRACKLAECLATLKRHMPHVSMTWDYATTAMNADVRAVWRRYEPHSTGSLTGVMKRGEVSEELRRIDPSQVSGDDGIKVEPLYELMTPKLTVQFITRTVVEGGDGRQLVFLGITEQTSEVSNGAFGEEVLTIELRGPAIDNGEITQAAEPVPAGNYAEFLHIAFQRLWHKAQWTRQRGQCDFSVVVGQMWTITGMGRTIEGVCVQVTHEISRGRTTVVLGPPTRLSTLSLPLTERLRREPEQYGSAGKDEDGSSTDMGEEIEVDMPTDGEDWIYAVRARPIGIFTEEGG